MKPEQIKETYSNFIFLRTYSRWLDKLNRRETWDETVNRYRDYNIKRVPESLMEEFLEAIETIRDKQIMPSMRFLWVAGKACDVDNIALYNCAYTPIDKLERFHEILYILMNGVGVGYSVERQEINKLPIIASTPCNDEKRTIIVEDSKEGWAMALKDLLSDWYLGIPSDWDVSKVRPEGAPLKTFGGRASGSRPLVDLFNFAKHTIFNAKGRRLNSQEISDIVCKIAQVVIVGGVRRSACICFTNLSDPRMRRYKEGEYWTHSSHRAYANISVAYTEKPDMPSFMEEWMSLMMSGTGERGIVNTGMYPDNTMRMNPCQPANAPILTYKGLSTIGQLHIGDTIWSEDGWVQVINKQSSGIQKVYKYVTTAGYFIGTKEHKIVSNGEKVEVGEAESIDTLQGQYYLVNQHDPSLIMDGLVLGDGSVHKASNNAIYLEIGQHDKDYLSSEVKELIERPCGISDYSYIVKTNILPEELPYTYERTIPTRYKCMGHDAVCSFLRGLYTANGSVVRQRITYKTASRQMVDDIQLLLSSIGISSYFTTNKEKNVEFSNGVYTCKESYDINISTHSERFMKLIGFIQEYKNKKGWDIARDTDRGKKIYDVKDVIYVGEEEVFDITVNGEHHTYWTGGLNVSNCGERILLPQQLCNLSEVVVTQDITPNELKRRVKLATLLGTLQATYTKFNKKILSKEWIENTKKDAMLGVSITGTSNRDWTEEELQGLRSYSKMCNEFYAEEFGINPAYGITNNKPSGTVSQLVGCSSGIHPDYSEYYIRRVRVAKTDPLCTLLREQGVPNDPEVGSSVDTADTFVFSFPTKGSALRVKAKEDALSQLEYYKLFKENWCDERGNPSCTIYVKEDEWLKVGAWVYENWDCIGGLSFLPADGGVYQLAPYEEITKEQYEQLCATFPEVDFNKLPDYEKYDTTIGAKEYACTAGQCELR